VEFKQGKYSVVLNENFTNRKVLLSFGVRSREQEINPNYPILAWDGKGTRLAVVYNEEGKTKLFVYDVVTRIKVAKQELHQFDQGTGCKVHAECQYAYYERREKRPDGHFRVQY
jgi:hypothetical protein